MTLVESMDACSKCHLALGDRYVKALDTTFHQDCFTCSDCNQPLSGTFLPHPSEPGHVLCENDYNKRLDLFCAQCHEPLRGTYTIAFDKKYHPDHFTCADCSVPLGQGSFYEHDHKGYCADHYGARFAKICTGCSKHILKTCVEVKENEKVNHWHQECYKTAKA